MYLYSLECLRFHDFLNFISLLFCSPPSLLTMSPTPNPHLCSPLPAPLSNSECCKVSVVPWSVAERKETVSTIIYFIGAVALFWQSPRCPPCPLLLPLAAAAFMRTLALAARSDCACLSPQPCAQERLGSSSFQEARPLHPPCGCAGAARAERAPGEGNPHIPQGCGGSGGTAVGDCGGFFCREDFLFPSFSLFFPHILLRSHFCFLEISLTWLLISCAQHEGLVSKTSLLVFYYLVSIPHKIVLNGKTRNSLPNQRLLFYFEASRVHSSEAEAALSFWWHEGQWCQAVGDSLLRAVPLFFYSLSGFFFNPEWSWCVLYVSPAVVGPWARLDRSLSPLMDTPSRHWCSLLLNLPTLLGKNI